MSAGRVVYVGSIPYDQTEEQILDIFRSVGPVANFKLVFDKDTGKSKGFGFVEYHDQETAASAVRNLNNFPIGSRNLRVDYSHEASLLGSAKALPQLPVGTRLPPGMSGPEAVSLLLNTFPPSKKLQIITDLKSVINSNVAVATELLRSSPQLAFAVVQSMLALGLVDPARIASIVDQPPVAAAPQNATPQPSSLPVPPHHGYPSQHYNQPPPQAAYSHPPPQSPQQYAQQGRPVQPSSGFSQPDPQQAALIKQVMLLSDQQINELPAEQREAIVILRQRVRNGEIQI